MRINCDGLNGRTRPTVPHRSSYGAGRRRPLLGRQRQVALGSSGLRRASLPEAAGAAAGAGRMVGRDHLMVTFGFCGAARTRRNARTPRILLLVGRLNWTNTESLLIYPVAGLARFDKKRPSSLADVERRGATVGDGCARMRIPASGQAQEHLEAAGRSQRRACWYTIAHGGRSLGIQRYRVSWRCSADRLKTARGECVR
ncbi:hypothetical protein NTH_02812 [Nitratireductor thuwali]|uniref:Uncharacterized protein n=1 Tax=Nitratireductor thuwali TaxID=2267699 RepID=A0ABY5MLM2_9HYPH|nr:hypothetical protein NTH_02812 [Nitratireductor thuwali]